MSQILSPNFSEIVGPNRPMNFKICIVFSFKTQPNQAEAPVGPVKDHSTIVNTAR